MLFVKVTHKGIYAVVVFVICAGITIAGCTKSKSVLVEEAQETKLIASITSDWEVTGFDSDSCIESFPCAVFRPKDGWKVLTCSWQESAGTNEMLVQYVDPFGQPCIARYDDLLQGVTTVKRPLEDLIWSNVCVGEAIRNWSETKRINIPAGFQVRRAAASCSCVKFDLNRVSNSEFELSIRQDSLRQLQEWRVIQIEFASDADPSQRIHRSIHVFSNVLPEIAADKVHIAIDQATAPRTAITNRHEVVLKRYGRSTESRFISGVLPPPGLEVHWMGLATPENDDLFRQAEYWTATVSDSKLLASTVDPKIQFHFNDGSASVVVPIEVTHDRLLTLPGSIDFGEVFLGETATVRVPMAIDDSIAADELQIRAFASPKSSFDLDLQTKALLDGNLLMSWTCEREGRGVFEFHLVVTHAGTVLVNQSIHASYRGVRRNSNESV